MLFVSQNKILLVGVTEILVAVDSTITYQHKPYIERKVPQARNFYKNTRFFFIGPKGGTSPTLCSKRVEI